MISLLVFQDAWEEVDPDEQSYEVNLVFEIGFIGFTVTTMSIVVAVDGIILLTFLIYFVFILGIACLG